MSHLFDLFLPSLNEFGKRSRNGDQDSKSGALSRVTERLTHLNQLTTIRDLRILLDDLSSEAIGDITTVTEFDAIFVKPNLSFKRQRTMSGFLFSGQPVMLDCNDPDGIFARNVMTREPVPLQWVKAGKRFSTVDDNGTLVTISGSSAANVVSANLQFANSAASNYEDNMKVVVESE